MKSRNGRTAEEILGLDLEPDFDYQKENYTVQKILKEKIKDFTEKIEFEGLACGEEHSFFILKGGRLFACGKDSMGRLGFDRPWSNSSFVPVP